ncbi:MAG: hypothetical protein ACYDGN_05315 [Acidimicrobiales bacterium]
MSRAGPATQHSAAGLPVPGAPAQGRAQASVVPVAVLVAPAALEAELLVASVVPVVADQAVVASVVPVVADQAVAVSGHPVERLAGLAGLVALAAACGAVPRTVVGRLNDAGAAGAATWRNWSRSRSPRTRHRTLRYPRTRSSSSEARPLNSSARR